MHGTAATLSGRKAVPFSKTPFGIALLTGGSYLVLTSIYIVVSSTLLGSEVNSPEIMVRGEIVKGLLFVGVSSLLLFALVYRFSRNLERRGRLLTDVFQVVGLPVVVMEAEPPHRLLLASQGATDLLDLERPDAAVSLPSVLERTFPQQDDWRAVLAGERSEAEWTGTLAGRNGETTPVEIRMQHARAGQAGLPAVLMVLADISERQRAAEELVRRERRFRLAMDQYPYPAGIADRDERLTFVNEAFLNVTGLTQDRMLGRTYAELGAPNADDAMAMVREALATGDVRTRLMTDDFGDPPLIYEVMANPLRAPDGKVLEVLVLTRDVSEHVRREEEVRRHERTLWALIEALPIPVSLSRWKTGEILVANQAFQELYELNGDLTSLLAEAAYQDPSDRLLMNREFEEQGFVDGRELQLLTAKGRHLTVIANIIPFDYEGQSCRLSAVIDITKLRATERALIHAQRLEAVGRLTGGLAHDFNNLLMTIQMSLELMAEDASSRDDQLIGTALAAVQRGGDLTHRLLAFSRQQLLKPQRIDLNHRISELYPILRSSAGDTVSIELELAPDLRPAELDAAQFDTAILNLVINARDAMLQGGRVIIRSAPISLEGAWTCSVTGDVPPGDYLKVSVIDEGHGIADDIRQKLFEPFFTTKLHGKGTGLGLSMVYGFVQQSGGAIEVESTPGNGAAFHLFFPCAAGESHEPGAQAPSRSPLGSADTADKALMLVDDDEPLRRSMARLLQRGGFAVRAYPDAHSALAALENGLRPDLVLTDVALPGNFNGLQLAARVREMLPECPVLCMTGHVEPEELARLGDIGDLEILRKPFPLAELTDRLRTLLFPMPETPGP